MTAQAWTPSQDRCSSQRPAPGPLPGRTRLITGILHRLRRWCRSVCLLIALLPIALAAQPASIDERSPMTQGVWWNPGHPGSGFEIFTIGNQAGVLWYTYAQDGKPLWYLAQGALSGLGRQDWPLLQYRWSGGTVADIQAVGTLRLSLGHPESATVTWRILEHSGTWPIEPLRFSGVIPEVDRSGAWFAPAAGGWGLTLVEQGKLLAAGLYTYDAQGNPVWFTGHDGGTRTSLSLHAHAGACPWCSPRPSTSVPAGTLALNLESEASLSILPRWLQAPAVATPHGSTRMTQLSRPASLRPADRQLARLGNTNQLRQVLEAGLMQMSAARQGPSGTFPGASFSSAPGSSSSAAGSQINLQEAGVDEADVVRHEGQLVWTFAADLSGKTLPRLRTARIEDDGHHLRITGEHPLKADPAALGKLGLYVTSDRVISVTGSVVTAPAGAVDVWATSSYWRGGVTDIEIFDARANGVPESLWQGRMNGYLLASRRVGNRLYVVTRHVPDVAGFEYTASLAVPATNRQILDRTPTAALIPTLSINGSLPQPLLAASDIHVPPLGARASAPDIFAVTAIALDEPAVIATFGVVGIMDTVYASASGLYLVGARSVPKSALPGTTGIEPPYYSDVHLVRFSEGRLTHGGSATVEGFVDQKGNNTPLRLSELNGQLRIVTSSSVMWGGENRNRLTVLEPSVTTPGLLRTVSFLPNEARPAPLGKPGELLFATRFEGDKLYAVTLRRVDPLYVVDLANPADPVIAGELEVIGTSDYLHPLPNGLLLGIGRDAYPVNTPGNGSGVLFQGLQFSLYDVSTPGRPRELQKFLMGMRGSTSPALNNHLAFTTRRLDDGTLDIAFPAVIHQPGGLSMTSGTEAITQPWHHTGLLRFRLAGSTPQTARLWQEETLVAAGVSGPVGRASDREGRTARGLLFPRGEVYINDGRFWLRRADGSQFVTD